MADEEKGLDRCIRTIVAAVMSLRDCDESDSDIANMLIRLPYSNGESY